MRQENFWRDFENLPPEAQKQVMDFISFLQTRYKSAPRRKVKRAVRMRDESFVGIWRGREDMQDSVRWVRDQRKPYWGG